MCEYSKDCGTNNNKILYETQAYFEQIKNNNKK